jgi:hypothetical protein
MPDTRKPEDKDQSASTGAEDEQRTSPTAQPVPDVAPGTVDPPEQGNVAGDPDVDTSDDAEHNPPQNGNDPADKAA